jgi:hypothetical protein
MLLPKQDAHFHRVDTNRSKEKRFKNTFTCGEEILVRRYPTSSLNLDTTTEGPFRISKINTNGSVVIESDGTTETVGIRLLVPYQQHKRNEGIQEQELLYSKSAA